MNAVRMEKERSDAADVARFLEARRQSILDDAAARARRAHLRHYEAEGSIEKRLPALYDVLVAGVSTRDLGPIVAYCRAVAAARFTAGFDLSEVQTAFNVLEEATWRHALAELPPGDAAVALGLIGTVLGAGKDALARGYVEHAARAHAPSMDLDRLVAGTDDAWLDW